MCASWRLLLSSVDGGQRMPVGGLLELWIYLLNVGAFTFFLE